MSRYFTKFAVAALLVMGMAGASRAQDAVAEKDIIRPITKSGSAAFLFTIQGLGTFGIGAPTNADAAGTELFGAGMKYYFADNLALRAMIGFNNSSQKASDTASSKPGATNLAIGLGVEYHFRPLYSTSPYIGGQISYFNASTDNDVSGAGSLKTSRNTLAITALAGFDWFFTHGLAVGAEYGLGFASTGGSNTVGTTENDLGTSSFIGINGGGNVHLVVYF